MPANRSNDTIRTEVVLYEREWLLVYEEATRLEIDVATFIRHALNEFLGGDRIQVRRKKGRPRRKGATAP